jgi:hypothetical protein
MLQHPLSEAEVKLHAFITLALDGSGQLQAPACLS